MSHILIIKFNTVVLFLFMILLVYTYKKYRQDENIILIVISLVGSFILMALGFILEELIAIKNTVERIIQ